MAEKRVVIDTETATGEVEMAAVITMIGNRLEISIITTNAVGVTDKMCSSSADSMTAKLMLIY